MSSEWADAPQIEMRIILQVPKVKTAILVGLDKFLVQLVGLDKFLVQADEPAP